MSKEVKRKVNSFIKLFTKLFRDQALCEPLLIRICFDDGLYYEARGIMIKHDKAWNILKQCGQSIDELKDFMERFLTFMFRTYRDYKGIELTDLSIELWHNKPIWFFWGWKQEKGLWVSAPIDLDSYLKAFEDRDKELI